MAESNETIVSLEHVKDIYKIETEFCKQLVKTFDIISRKTFKLAEAWDKFKNRHRST